MNKLPTRIIEKPFFDKNGRIRNILCDDGLSYTMTNLSRLLNMSTPNLRARINKFGWNSDKVLIPVKNSRKIIKLKKKKDPIELDIIDGDLAYLNDRKCSLVRSKNLEKITGPTKFDIKFGSQPIDKPNHNGYGIK